MRNPMGEAAPEQHDSARSASFGSAGSLPEWPGCVSLSSLWRMLSIRYGGLGGHALVFEARRSDGMERNGGMRRRRRRRRRSRRSRVVGWGERRRITPYRRASLFGRSVACINQCPGRERCRLAAGRLRRTCYTIQPPLVKPWGGAPVAGSS